MNNDDCFVRDLLLLQTAAHYNLLNKKERTRSNEDLLSLFYMLQERIRPDLTVEIGAFNATFSVEMRRRGIRAIAFEANPYNYEHFRKNSNLVNIGVEYLHMAISNWDGHIDFHVQKIVEGEPVSSIRGNNSLMIRNQDGVEYEQVSVPCASLASFLRKWAYQRSSSLSGSTLKAQLEMCSMVQKQFLKIVLR